MIFILSFMHSKNELLFWRFFLHFVIKMSLKCHYVHFSKILGWKKCIVTKWKLFSGCADANFSLWCHFAFFPKLPFPFSILDIFFVHFWSSQNTFGKNNAISYLKKGTTAKKKKVYGMRYFIWRTAYCAFHCVIDL